MKKKISALLAIILVVCMATTLFGCSKKPKQVAPDVALGDIGESIVAEKVGNVNRDSFYTARGGLYYEDENGKYGIMSIEGRYDTGAIYSYCEPEEMYFAVSLKVAADYNDVNGLNSFGLVDSRGKILVPMKYASVRVMNDRYVLGVVVTERTFNKDDAIIYYDNDNSTISFSPDDDDILYKGKWEVYDVVAGRTVSGITGTNDDTPFAKGNFITFKNADGNYTTVDSNGTPVSEDAKIFDDGSYAIEGKVGDVFATDGTKLFSYDLTGFQPSSVVGDVYIANKYVDGSSLYAVMDKKGNIISAEFNDYISVYSEVILCGEKVYNYEGKQLIDFKVESVTEDKVFGSCYLLRDDDLYYMIKSDGTILYTGVDSDDISVFTSDFVASKKSESDYTFFSHKDKDYTIKGYSFAPWLIKTNNANSLYNIVDSMTGETLFEGYSNYSYSETDSTAYYVYAKYNGGADVYLIISSTQIEATTQKKQNLLDDLVNAFKAEGINVSINKETGEMSLDSSVLFGGDSSELTADGKNFLNKFIKVYANITFSDKYAGFISKTMVEGHTAPVAGSTYASGLQLSEERAANVKNYCLSPETGVTISSDAMAFEAVGYSNSQPVYKADGSVNMEASRRVSFRFMVNVPLS